MIEPLDYKRTQGVYKIYQPDGKFYIGSSVNLYNRLRGHKSIFSKNSRDYLRIEYTCKWEDLEVEILEHTQNLNSKQLKDIEDVYIKRLWSDDILNKEKMSKGRDISLQKNPNWKNNISKNVKYCICNKIINNRSKLCYSCRAKERHQSNKVDKNKRFI